MTKPAEQDQEGEAQEAQEDEELDPQTVTEREEGESDRTTDAPLVGRHMNCGVCTRTGGLWEKSSTSIEAWRSTVLRFRTEAVTMSQMMTLMGLT